MTAHTQPRPALAPLEMWGGIECSLVRIGDSFVDQFRLDGHDNRLFDLDTFANLGLRVLRYPVSWERVCPAGDLKHADWSWIDARMQRFRDLGIKPIVGLVHHGSGPLDTGLTEPCFPGKLAAFARAAAERYPWVTDWTPINEPLTTARFSGLYGHWYPHGNDEQTFVRALLGELRGTVLAMRAIREVTPGARLIQTEDLGKTWSTHHLAYQAEFENERRWLSFDLLCGRVTDDRHRLWEHLTWAGATEEELCWFAQNPCPPDVLGVNYYVTGERFLDERLDRYPSHTHGTNGRDVYADVEAVRVLRENYAGPKAILTEAWQRYGLPIAITEAHLGCTREEQMRWLTEVWEAAQTVRNEVGADVRAVTAWALQGAHEWNSLLTRQDGYYESGVFDTRGRSGPHVRPRPTALAFLVKEIIEGKTPSHPVLAVPGWWRRTQRFVYPPVSAFQEDARAASTETLLRNERRRVTARPILITGGQSALAQSLVRACDARGLACRLLNRAALDITDEQAIEKTFDKYQPWAVINAAGYTRVNAAFREPLRCYRENTRGPMLLAQACARKGVRLSTFSSARVFDGGKRPGAYLESDTPHPRCVYGWSKVLMEERVLRALPDAFVVRTSALFGPNCDGQNFLTAALQKVALGHSIAVADDEIFTPAYLPDLVETVLDLLLDEARGIWHLAHPDPISRLAFVRHAAQALGLDADLVRPVSADDCTPWAVLASERTASLLPPLTQAMECYAREAADRYPLRYPVALPDFPTPLPEPKVLGTPWRSLVDLWETGFRHKELK